MMWYEWNLYDRKKDPMENEQCIMIDPDYAEVVRAKENCTQLRTNIRIPRNWMISTLSNPRSMV